MTDKEHDEPLLPIDATAIQVCGSAVGQMAEIWDELSERTGQGHGDFIPVIFEGIWRDGDTGEEFEDQFNRWDEQPEDMKPLALLQAVFTSCAYACQAMKAEKDGQHVRAWQYTARCKYWLGIVVGEWSVRREHESPASEFAKLGATARHKENRAMKEQVLQWYEENRATVSSKDAAAEAIAGKVVPATFRTVRDWLKGR